MRPFSQQQIKQLQLDLLIEEGVSLQQFQVGQSSHFSPQKDLHLSNQSEINKINLENTYKVTKSNYSHLQLFACLILKVIFKKQIKEDLLHILKTSVLNFQSTQAILSHQSSLGLSDRQIKKIIVEFLYELVYSSEKNKVQRHLNKFPTILNSLVLILRFISSQFSTKDGNKLEKAASNKQSYEILINFFDLNYKKNGNIYLFYEQNLFIAQYDAKYVYIGEYSPRISEQTNQSTTKNQDGNNRISFWRNSFDSPLRQSITNEFELNTPFFRNKQIRKLAQSKLQKATPCFLKQKQNNECHISKHQTKKRKSKTQRLDNSHPNESKDNSQSDICQCSKQATKKLIKTKVCKCKTKAKQKIKLQSNIYAIKIWFQYNRNPPQQTYSRLYSGLSLYTCCQGVGLEIYDSFPAKYNSQFNKSYRNNKSNSFYTSKDQSCEKIPSKDDTFSPREELFSNNYRISIDCQEKSKQSLSFRKLRLKPKLLNNIIQARKAKTNNHI